MNRIRFRYACGKELRYLSHLDMLRLFQRAMRRAGLPLGDDYAGEQRWRLHRQGLYIYKEVLIDPFPEGGEMADG